MIKQPSIDVIIPSYNSKKTIVKCLDSVLNQSYKRPYKVIVVDSSNDGTDKLIKTRYTSVKLIHFNEKVFPGKARNIGLKYTTADYVAFTDTDCIVDYYWLEQITESFRTANYDAVGGSILNGTQESIVGTLGYLNEFSFYMPGINSGPVTATATANVTYRRNIFSEYQFIENSFAGEDTVFHWVLVNNGSTLFFNSKIKVTHINKKYFFHVVKHQKEIGKGAAIARVIMKKDMILAHFPLLCLIFLPWIRLLRMKSRLFIYENKLFWKTFLFFPISYIIAFSWSWGFYQTMIKHKKTTSIKTN